MTNVYSEERQGDIDVALHPAAGSSGGVFHRMLLALATGQRAAAEEIFSQIRGGTLSAAGERRVQKLLTGERPLTHCDDTFFVGLLTDQQRSACLHARTLLSAHGLRIDKVLVIEFATVQSGFAAALPIDDQSTYLCIGGMDENELAAATVHEFCHVALSSGNRFLDEGAAYYFESLSQGRDCADLSQQIADQPTLPPVDLRTLLAYEARDDAYFDLLLPGNNLRVHARGALLFAELVRRAGVEAIVQVYSRIRSDGANADAAFLIEQATQTVIEELETGGAVQAPCAAAAMGASDIAPAEAAYVAGDTARLLQLYDAIFLHGRAMVTEDGRLAEAEMLVLAAGAIERGFEREITRFESAYVRARLLQFLSRQGRSSRYYLFRALMTIARASCEGSILDSTLLFDEAKTDLELALARDANDPLVLSCLARIEWSLPHGGASGKMRAIALLKRIAAVPTYRQHVEGTLNRCLAQLEGDNP